MKNKQALHILEKSFILDMHVHAAGIGVDSGCYISSRLARNWRYSLYLRAFNTSKKDIEQYGDTIIIKRLWESLRESRYVDGALLLALDKVYDPVSHEPDQKLTEIYIPNEFIRDTIVPLPQLYYGASVNPYRKDWQEELQRVHDDKALLIKWLPAIQHIDPSDPVIIPFYRKLKELGLPLLVHTGEERSFSSSNDALGDPGLLHLPLQEGVTVIAAHVATTGKSNGSEYIDILFDMLARYENLYTDISSLTQLNKRMYPCKVLKRKDLFGKLLFGSDFPLTNAGFGIFKLVSPLYFYPTLPLSKIISLIMEKNVWDRDVLLKHSLGFPMEVFTRPAELLLKQ